MGKGPQEKVALQADMSVKKAEFLDIFILMSFSWIEHKGKFF